jgi:hypothetical protein
MSSICWTWLEYPFLAAERTEYHPFVIAGGSSTLNPEPMADFIDLFVLAMAKSHRGIDRCFPHLETQQS